MKKNRKLFILFMVFSFSMAFFLLNFMRVESDYYWHVKAGDYMFHNGILKNDVFSWIVNGKYWMSHEWLFEIIIYLFSIIFKSSHLLVYGFISICSLLFILFIYNREDYLKNVPFGMIWIVFSLILLPFMQARPHLISFNLLAISIILLFNNYKNENDKSIYLLPLISIIWANVHGGSSNLVYLLCILFFICGLVSFNCKKVYSNRISKVQLKRYLIVCILCIISISFNIHGVKMILYPYQNMMDSTMLNNINEWAPTNFNIGSHYMYLLLIVFILFIMLFSDKKIKFIHLMLFGFSVLLGLKSIRFWAYTYIICSFIVFDYVKSRKVDSGTYSCIISMCIVFILFPIFNFNSISKQINNRELSNEVITILKSNKPKRLFNVYDYGGELVNNDILVFIDGRADLYSKYNYKDYLNISNLDGDYIKLIDKYDFDYFLVNTKFSINTYLKYNDNYELIYKNSNTRLYKKNTD